MNNVIITGATGMIGATMIEQMVSRNIHITAIVRPNSSKINNIKSHDNVKIIECEVNDLLKLKNEITVPHDTFYHFAWNGTYGTSRDDAYIQEQNIKDTVNAVELAHELKCNAFIGAGSQAEFGHVEGKVSDINSKNPVTGYGIAKYAAGKLSKLACDKYGIRHSWGRVLSAYGPKDNSYTMIMSSVVGMVNGERLRFTKGDQIWDYIYSEDCARAFYLIGEKGKHGKAYTIGSGKTRKLSEFITIMRDSINPNLEIGIGERDYYPNQVMELCADIYELNKDTGFRPLVMFEDGIAHTINWYKENR